MLGHVSNLIISMLATTSCQTWWLNGACQHWQSYTAICLNKSQVVSKGRGSELSHLEFIRLCVWHTYNEKNVSFMNQNIDYIVHKTLDLWLVVKKGGIYLNVRLWLLWIRVGSNHIKRTGHFHRFGLAAAFSRSFWHIFLLEFDFVCLDSYFVLVSILRKQYIPSFMVTKEVFCCVMSGCVDMTLV